jgi:hypothetical protein
VTRPEPSPFFVKNVGTLAQTTVEMNQAAVRTLASRAESDEDLTLLAAMLGLQDELDGPDGLAS